jgi:hypothetical protein
MKNTALLLFVVLGSCSSAEEQPTFPGVRTRLILLDGEAKVGGPLRIRLDLVNDTDTALLYDAQGCSVNGSFEVLGPDGKSVPSVDGPRSSFGHLSPLAARSSVTLIEETDLTHQYAISRPGRFQITFYGTVSLVDAARYARAEKEAERTDDAGPLFDLPSWVQLPSNGVTVDVRPGPVPEKFAVAAKLRAALPPKWEFAINWWPPRTDDPEYTLFRPERKKGDSVIVVRLSQGPPVKDERKAGEALGKNIYIRSSEEDEKAWPDHRRRLVEILNDP